MASILIVDDDRALRSIFNKRLHSVGYDVLEAYNGQVGLEMAIEHLPDAIILDIEMPVMDGLDMLTMLRNTASASDIPVILVTATTIVDNLPGVEQANLVLQKPVSTRELITHISAVITNPPD